MTDNSNLGGVMEKMQRYQQYIQALEEERRKIQVFERELPLCLELVTQAIETCKHQLSGPSTEYNLHAQSDASEQISSDGPVIEEFIPLKRVVSHPDLVEEQESQKPRNGSESDDKEGNESCTKPDWLRSVQLWNQTPDLPTNSKQDSPRKVAVVEVKRNGSSGAFHPFKKEKTPTDPPPLGTAEEGVAAPASASSTAESGGVRKKEEKDGKSQRKSRRCWSPELHRRFLQALEHLGGSHVATPKQIRELMKVDGLTNDEVKSHLQKYRLHTRRPSPSAAPVTAATQQAPQFVVVGGIWVPPEYASKAAVTASGEASGSGASRGIYAPVATHLPSFQEPSTFARRREHRMRSQLDDRSSDSDGGAQSHSSATSSSMRGITVSPAH